MMPNYTLIIPTLKKMGAIKLCYLFGSVVSQKMTPESDIDIAVYVDTLPSLETRMQVLGQLESILHRPVDLVFLKGGSTILAYQILKYGELIYAADTQFEKQFVMQMLTDYCELKFLRKAAEDKLLSVFSS